MNTKGNNNQEQAGAINRCWNVRKLMTTSRRRRSIISEAKRRKSFYLHHVILKYINPSLLALVMSKYQPSPNTLFERNIVPLCCFLVGIVLYGAVEYIATRNHRYFDLLSRLALSLVILTTISLVSLLVVKNHVPVVPFVISTLLPLILSVCWPVLRLAYTWLLEKIKHKILEKLVWLKRGEDSSKECASSALV